MVFIYLVIGFSLMGLSQKYSGDLKSDHSKTEIILKTGLKKFFFFSLVTILRPVVYSCPLLPTPNLALYRD